MTSCLPRRVLIALLGGAALAVLPLGADLRPPLARAKDGDDGDEGGGRGRGRGGRDGDGGRGRGRGGDDGDEDGSPGRGGGDDAGENGGRGGDDRNGGEDGSRRDARGRDVTVLYPDGWTERIVQGRYELLDDHSRLVVARPATDADRARMLALR